jgi:hypothetical protein
MSTQVTIVLTNTLLTAPQSTPPAAVVYSGSASYLSRHRVPQAPGQEHRMIFKLINRDNKTSIHFSL